MSEKKLYIEYRVYFNPDTNQELLHKVAEVGQDEVFNLFDGQTYDDDGNKLPSPQDVTYEVVMEAPEVIRDREWKL